MSARKPVSPLIACSPERGPRQQNFSADEKRLVFELARSLGCDIPEDAFTDVALIDFCDDMDRYVPDDMKPTAELQAILHKVSEIKRVMIESLDYGPLDYPKMKANDTVYTYMSKFEMDRRRYPMSVRTVAAYKELEPDYGKRGLKELDYLDDNDQRTLILYERLIAIEAFISEVFDRATSKAEKQPILDMAYRSREAHVNMLYKAEALGVEDRVEIDRQHLMLAIADIMGNVGQA